MISMCSHLAHGACTAAAHQLCSAPLYSMACRRWENVTYLLCALTLAPVVAPRPCALIVTLWLCAVAEVVAKVCDPYFTGDPAPVVDGAKKWASAYAQVRFLRTLCADGCGPVSGQRTLPASWRH